MRIIKKVSLLSAFSFLVACTSPDEPIKNEEYTLSDKAVALPSHAVDTLSREDITADTLTLNESALEGRTFSPGEIIAIPPSPGTRTGILRKVVSVESTSGSTVVHTEPAALTEYVEEASFTVSGTIEPKGLTKTSQNRRSSIKPVIIDALPGVSLNTADSFTRDATVGSGCEAEEITSEFDLANVPLDEGLTLEGCISFSLDFEIDGDIRVGSFKYFKAEVTGTQISDITLTSSVFDPKYSREYKIASLNLGVIPAGPVYITPEVDVIVGIDGDLNASVQIAGASEIKPKLGLQHTDKWEPISEYPTSFDFNGPTINATASASTYAGVELNFLVYSLLGVGITSHGYVELAADIASDPWWQLYGGFRAGVQAVGEVWDVNFFEFEKPDLVDYIVQIAKAESGFIEEAEILYYNSFTNLSEITIHGAPIIESSDNTKHLADIKLSSKSKSSPSALNLVPGGNPVVQSGTAIISAMSFNKVVDVSDIDEVTLSMFYNSTSNPRVRNVHNCDSAMNILYRLDGNHWQYLFAHCGEHKSESSGWNKYIYPPLNTSTANTVEFALEYSLQNSSGDSGVYFLIDDFKVYGN